MIQLPSSAGDFLRVQTFKVFKFSKRQSTESSLKQHTGTFAIPPSYKSRSTLQEMNHENYKQV